MCARTVAQRNAESLLVGCEGIQASLQVFAAVADKQYGCGVEAL